MRDTVKSMVSAEATVIMDKASAFGFNSVYDPEHPVPTDKSKRIQVRNQLFDPTYVKDLGYALQAGAKFPPLVFTADGYLLDGNQRSAAYTAEGITQTSAIIITLAYERASAIERDQLVELGAFLNLGPKGLTLEEKKQRILENSKTADSSGAWIKHASRAFGLPVHQIRGFLTEQKGHDLLKRIGITTTFRSAELRQIVAASHRMTPYALLAMVELADQASFNSREIRELTSQLTDKQSEDDQLEFVQALRTTSEVKQRMVARKSGRRVKPSNSAQAGRLCGYFTNPKYDLVEHNSDLIKLRIQQYRAAIARLSEALAKMEDEV